MVQSKNKQIKSLTRDMNLQQVNDIACVNVIQVPAALKADREDNEDEHADENDLRRVGVDVLRHRLVVVLDGRQVHRRLDRHDGHRTTHR